MPRVLFSNIPSTSIQCFAVFRSTPVSPVTGCGIMPKLAAAFDASDMIRLRKLAGSSSGSLSCACDCCGSARGAGAGLLRCGSAFGAARDDIAFAAAFSTAAACAARSASSFSCGDSSRGDPSGLKGRRSTTLNVGCSSLMVLKHDAAAVLKPSSTTDKFEIRTRSMLAPEFMRSQRRP